MLSQVKFSQLFWLVIVSCLLPTPSQSRIAADGTTSTEIIGPDSSNFINAVDIEKIISPITGGNIPRIDGLLQEADHSLELDDTEIVAQTNPAEAESLESLRKYAGKYANDKVLMHPFVRKSLVKFLGQNVSKLDHYTLVASPVDMISDDIVAAGCAPHECIDKAAIVVVQLNDGKVHAAILENKEIVIYSNQKDYAYLPKGLTDWIEETKQKAFEFTGTRIKIHY